MKILVAIANHGTGNRHYLDRLLAAYQAMPVDVHVVILSNIPKDVGLGVEVRVGVPSKNPWSLPFAHRALFLERLEAYDYFIYSEDDTLLTWPVLEAFIRAETVLEPSELSGFLRTEQGPDGRLYYSTCHSFFRWLPDSVRVRGGEVWARYSNEHSACYAISQKQLRQVIANGGFPTEPHEGRFDMLCSAATDVYTNGGLERLVSVDRLSAFRLPHLPNKYIGRYGLPEEEMEWQLAALREVAAGRLPRGELLDPETYLPGCHGAKLYRELADPVFTGWLAEGGRKILVWGAGDGLFEQGLARLGNTVSVIPLNSIVGECCRHRGLMVVSEESAGADADVVLLRDVLQVVDAPEKLIEKARGWLRSGGQLMVRVPNFYTARLHRLRWKDPRFDMAWDWKSMGARPWTRGGLRGLLHAGGFASSSVQGMVEPHLAVRNRRTLGLFSRWLTDGLYVQATRR
jgi:hypothetical protein